MVRAKPMRRTLDLRPGEWVEVRSFDEILSTLDERGELDAMPFMPEMEAYCGKRFMVSRRADKSCDRVQRSGLRRMSDVVHLEDLRCDGSSHGGCQALCLLFWKEQWLRRVSDSLPLASRVVPSRIDRAGLLHAVRKPEQSASEEPAWSCQATEAFRASTRIPPWDLSHYIRDMRCGQTTLWRVLWWGATTTLNKIQGHAILLGR